MRWALVTVLALGAPALAGAIDWNGRVGVLYGRTDQWTPLQERTTAPQLDLDLALDGVGFLYRPGTFDWLGGLQYRRLATSFGGSDDVRGTLSYRLRSVLFSDPRSPFRLDLSALRADERSSLQGSSVGSGTAQSYSANALLALPFRPTLQAGYTYDDSQRVYPAIGDYSRHLHTVTGSTTHGTGVYSYTGSYRGKFSDGTYASDNYNEHQVQLGGTASLSDPVRLQFSDDYYLRLPKLNSQFNPRQETNSVYTAVNYGLVNNAPVQRGLYQYVHALQTAPLSSEVERTSHRGGYALERSLAPEWRLRGTADATYSDDRLGDVHNRVAGQAIGTSLVWRRTTDDDSRELRAGPSIGVLEPATGSTRAGWGAAAGGNIARTWTALRASLSYDVSYRSDLEVQGWELRQQGTAGADRLLGTGIFRAELTLAAERHRVALFGGGASRNGQARVEYRWEQNVLELRGTLSEGIAGSTTGVSGDGLFLPASYNTRVLGTSVSGSTLVWRRLSLTGRLTYSSTSLPDRPRLDEGEGYGAIDLVYGALRIGVEDRYAIAETTVGTARSNQILLRLYRVFGSR